MAGLGSGRVSDADLCAAPVSSPRGAGAHTVPRGAVAARQIHGSYNSITFPLNSTLPGAISLQTSGHAFLPLSAVGTRKPELQSMRSSLAARLAGIPR